MALYRATGDKKYYEYLDKADWDTADALFDKEEALFYGDRRFIANGKPWTDYNRDKETIILKDLSGTVAVTAQY